MVIAEAVVRARVLTYSQRTFKSQCFAEPIVGLYSNRTLDHLQNDLGLDDVEQCTNQMPD